MLVQEARIIASGWLNKWKKRHNISQMNIAGEEGDLSLNKSLLGATHQGMYGMRMKLAVSGRRGPRNSSIKRGNAVGAARMRSNE